jgi:hypothetical protein
MTFGVSAPSSVLFPDTKSLTPDVSVGKLDGGESAMISVPDIAVAETSDPPVPTDPDIDPIKAIFTLSRNKYHSHREDESDIVTGLN